ncbi:DMT family transporter [Chelativorans salis]|uniref:DMT family transporter n=1 Tax=Chelativorans salis TaxID=2978478 RepID=A0ABT2LLQ3_9HYPH|nr:DMT family transporter [Chelativorans sp. EGI FJ00035]MCT7375520.1 DMT family transporter [Chelativorans sp. EGI FJ00035]
MAFSPILRGPLFMSIAMAGFTINDALVKLVSVSMNMGQAMLLRGIFATALLVLLMFRNGTFGQPALLKQKSVVIRVVCEVGATITFLLALFNLPIANVHAVLQALPLGVTMGAALVFSEPVGWRRWSAIFAGFLGVLIIVRPGFAGFSMWSLLAVATVGFCIVRDLATRRIPANTPTALVSAATSFAVMACGGILVLPLGGWAPLTLSSTASLFAAAVALVVAYQFIITALRTGDISFLAPFRYTGLLWAIALGFFVFGDVPDGMMLLGAAIVVASGLYALYREQVVGRRKLIAESTGPGMAPEGT